MTTNQNRLVFGSDEANELLAKSKADKQNRLIKSKLNSLIDGVEEIGGLIAGVRGSENQRVFQPKIEELLREVNYLMIDASCDWSVSDELQETASLLDNAIYAMTSIAETLDMYQDKDDCPNEITKSLLYIAEFLAQSPDKRVTAAENAISRLID